MSNDNEYQFHLLSANPPIATLEVKKAFTALTHNEKKYLHYFSRASWLSSQVVFHQVSEESPIIFELFQTIFNPLFNKSDIGSLSTMNANDLLTSYRNCVINAGISVESFNYFIEYAAAFYANQGNYLSFGDTKFIPRCDAATFRLIASLSLPAIDADKNTHKTKIESLLNKCVDKIYSLAPKSLGYAFDGHETTYYSKNITKDDIALVGEFMASQSISPYNTRLFKGSDGVLELRIAAAKYSTGSRHTYKGATIQINYGDYNGLLKYAVSNLTKAKQYAANETQQKMLDAYIDHFDTGSMKSFELSQRYWVQDKQPAVETNIGFIESYRDPFGVRGEFEGLVAVVNKEQSAKFSELVTKSKVLLEQLPWPKEFEKDEFMKPDFTSLEVVTFANSGIPSGINIPNLDEVRQEIGFKNVSLANVITSAGSSDTKYTFISDDDQKLYSLLRVPAFEVQVGLHELLGHGSGKVFNEKEDGSVNFDRSLINPLTNKPIESWYAPGTSWDSKFTSLSSPYEECRAECVGLYLCVVPSVLEIFGYKTKSEQDDIIYTNWLSMVRAGLLALEFYSVDAKQWRQAHMRARFSILQVLLQAGNGLVDIKLNESKDDFIIKLDRSKILSVGVPAIGDYLKKLQIYKSTADVENGSKMFQSLTEVDLSKWEIYRNIVIAKKQPRKVYVQGHTRIIDDAVELTEFEPTAAALIRSNVLHFEEDN